ncbi:hypothetical protein A3F00_05555 [Candidatus Daviesbacteria bacterium RIFCSPHIGHO2_12_FULL_37_11]|uniref:Uncharacterized protein n=1 Tax=Candidatus Daviesbacteria bacterium RIFCSPHIGHO2_12_FULL_37_11 TaxID=1797777 RepID=A0A1F5K8R8_9BACT|nr:MAG: hypothetical protein A2769_03890 [Candidatus Daviesbacteria bacterium RIFCSPHIGHO2_01_FULL_37_27]OGE37317.1 MAG: hypothetical protein A3F00_05555 [Candidatus Daviesbacteria bacterium RIFCSPHIGHO2_12_FULL_37_11]OGE45331.1 MAG: hypothetical protein A3B39_01300 [Candidatus Daviesbacteria bacterium RIFCSPLOWO2_01_FULL_37_10]
MKLQIRYFDVRNGIFLKLIPIKSGLKWDILTIQALRELQDFLISRVQDINKSISHFSPLTSRILYLSLLITLYLSFISPVYADHCPDPINETHTDFGCISNDPIKFATSIYGIGLGLIGVVGLLSIVYGAFLVLTSQGDPTKLQNGRSYIVYALIGMALAVGGFAFYRIIAVNVIRIPGFQ